MLRKFLSDESGATAIEYGLIAALIALAIIAAVGQTGQRLVALFQSSDPGVDALLRRSSADALTAISGRCARAWSVHQARRDHGYRQQHAKAAHDG